MGVTSPLPLVKRPRHLERWIGLLQNAFLRTTSEDRGPSFPTLIMCSVQWAQPKTFCIHPRICTWMLPSLPAGDLIGTLDIDDPSAFGDLAKPVAGDFPLMGPPTPVPERAHQQFAEALKKAHLILAGYQHNVPEVRNSHSWRQWRLFLRRATKQAAKRAAWDDSKKRMSGALRGEGKIH